MASPTPRSGTAANGSGSTLPDVTPLPVKPPPAKRARVAKHQTVPFELLFEEFEEFRFVPKVK